MYIALRLLRDGAHTTITTRFPRDATRRFTGMPDSADWLHRLRIVGIDLRNPGQVVALADSVAEQGPLDILINNAAQTVRRSPEAYALLAAAEAAALPDGPGPEVLTIGPSSDAGRPAELHAGPGDGRHWSPTPDALAVLAQNAGSASPERIPPGPRSTPAAWSPISTRSTAGASASRRSTRSRCSRSSSATRPRRSS